MFENRVFKNIHFQKQILFWKILECTRIFWNTIKFYPYCGGNTFYKSEGCINLGDRKAHFVKYLKIFLSGFRKSEKYRKIYKHLWRFLNIISESRLLMIVVNSVLSGILQHTVIFV